VARAGARNPNLPTQWYDNQTLPGPLQLTGAQKSWTTAPSPASPLDGGVGGQNMRRQLHEYLKEQNPAIVSIGLDTC
jgi:hypothetical protein